MQTIVLRGETGNRILRRPPLVVQFDDIEDHFNIKIGPPDVEIWEGKHPPNLADGVGIESLD